jgi:diguanylate cyclase (GGDEF)-like protein
MIKSCTKTRPLLIVGIALAMCFVVFTWLVIRYFNSQFRAAFESRLRDIALISCNVDHNSARELCENNNMIFHKILPRDLPDLANASETSLPHDGEMRINDDSHINFADVYKRFEQNPGLFYFTDELIGPSNEKRLYTFAAARITGRCMSCHREGDMSFLRGRQKNELVGVFGTSISMEFLYAREQMFTIICVLCTLGLIAILAFFVQAALVKVRQEYERTQTMLDASPFSNNVWDEKCSIIECNLEALRLFGLSSKCEYFDRFFELSPERQPDGSLSRERHVELLKYAFDYGRIVFEWMHKKLTGELIPSEVTLVRVNVASGRNVIGYIRDLREVKDKTARLDIAEKMAFTDALTSIYNRRYFMQFAENEFLQQKDASKMLGIIMFDIDHFKKVNDTHGHEAGDAVLQAVTATAKGALSDTDVFARYGGEEFIVLVRQFGLDDMAKLASRICAKVEATDYYYQGTKIPVTISLGVAIRRDISETLEIVIKHADQALYRAKDGGRNRVEAFVEGC